VTSRPIALVTRSLIAPSPPESEQTVIVDMTPIPPSGPRVEAPPLEIAGHDGRARWTDAKRNPHHMFAAWLPALELSTIHSRHDVPATRRRRVVRALRADWRIFAIAIAASALVGIVVFFAMRVKLASDSPQGLPGARRVRAAPVVPKPPVFHVTMPSAEPAVPAPVLPDADPPTVQTPQLDDPSPKRTPGARKTVVAADATLRVNTIGGDAVWAFANLDGVRLEVPGAKFKATPGRHVVKLDNPKLDLALSCVVTLASHRTTSLNVDLESGRCQVIATQ
jgi:hypothetical protein